MALVTAGVWQTTAWPSNCWQEDIWPEYGYVPPPPPSAPQSVTYTSRTRPYKIRKIPPDLFEDREFLGLLTEFLEII